MRPQLPIDPGPPAAENSSSTSFLTSGSKQSDQVGGGKQSEPSIYTFWRGRVALYGILKSLGVAPGDSVLVPGFTCFAVPAAVRFAGARPLYVDIDRKTFNISVSALQSLWNSSSRANIKAVIIQHTFGMPADLNLILAWARERGIATIEDCAHAWDSRYRNERGDWIQVGTESDAALFSSQWTKPVSTGLGGWARVNNAELGLRLRRFHERDCVAPSFSQVALLASQVAVGRLFPSSWAHWTARSIYQWLYRRGFLIGTSTPDELRGEMGRGYAKRMSGFQQWLLKKQLADKSVQTHRRRLKGIYDAALDGAGLPVFEIPNHADPVLLRYPVRVGNKKRALREAQRRHIELGDWYAHPIDRPEGLQAEALAYRSGMCPEGERAAAEVVNLPMHLRVTEKTAHEAVDLLKEIA
ncbi:MAG TPA: DegT/DnrJ/EryC1/StrS family aminotransferase [Candidatus Cybelea sp.]|nr:DegT/DnrJ/EryC1/StrS family aminotransferase [Candidatus Cybelea sp.]